MAKLPVCSRGNGKSLFLIVDPVDWEKAQSIIEEAKRQGLRAQFCVIIDNSLPEKPAGVPAQLIRGNLRDPNTFWRAGLARAVGVFICASSYDKPGDDARTAAIASMVEGLRPEIISVAEQVSHANDDLFAMAGVDTTVVFDEVTLGAVVGCFLQAVRDLRVGNIDANTIDHAQRSELDAQLELAGLVSCGDGEADVQIILPKSLDNTSSDYEVWGALHRAEVTSGRYAAALYLSIKSEMLFRGKQNTVCADRVLAKAMVTAALMKLAGN